MTKKSADLLTLSMIVKDEARSIARTLRSAKPFVDRWVIVDTGSTDDTKEIVRREMEGVPGELCEAPFVDFETTRNLGLDRCGEATEFIFWLDADDELEGGAELRKFLEGERGRADKDREAYLVQLVTVVSFGSPRVLRSRAGWRFKGVVHEVLQHPERTPPVHKVPGAAIKHFPPPESLARTNQRRERDLRLLSGALEKNPRDARSAFYLACTYHWMGRYEEAQRAFRRRIDLGGWREEVYQAKYLLAEAAEKNEEPWPDVLLLYLDAHAHAPHRAEPLYRIALHYNAQAEHALCLVFARRAADLPYPKQDIHFVEADVYAWGVHDLIGTSAYFLGEYALGEAHAKKALAARPNDARLKANLGFYTQRKR